MYRKFLNARSPLRLLEKGLHGGLGIGNIGLLLAGRGVGKTPCIVGMAHDELLRGGCVLHVALDQTVSHVRNYYDTVYEALAESTHLDNAAEIHAEIDRRRSIRAYPPADFTASRLREAVKIEIEAGSKPSMILLEGFEPETLRREDLKEIGDLAQELAAEIWFSVAVKGEAVGEVPAAIRSLDDLISVILALEPPHDGHEHEHVILRALKDHENEDLSQLHVALDPRSLLLIRD